MNLKQVASGKVKCFSCARCHGVSVEQTFPDDYRKEIKNIVCDDYCQYGEYDPMDNEDGIYTVKAPHAQCKLYVHSKYADDERGSCGFRNDEISCIVCARCKGLVIETNYPEQENIAIKKIVCDNDLNTSYGMFDDSKGRCYIHVNPRIACDWFVRAEEWEEEEE